ncbi:MAG TPA: Mur ligase domain-containing protein, partial [Solirubrobacteraceae bacterium]|nr:Mur ligase domain-containing protein [Solirubrobacteraceae bacterium]
MRDWDARHLAAAAGASVMRPPSAAPTRPAEQANGPGQPGPVGVSIDSRALQPGELFVGLRGERTDGGAHAAQALSAGAWGVLVTGEHA